MYLLLVCAKLSLVCLRVIDGLCLFLQVMPNFTMYPGILPHVAHMRIKSNMPPFFLPDELKMVGLLVRNTYL